MAIYTKNNNNNNYSLGFHKIIEITKYLLLTPRREEYYFYSFFVHLAILIFLTIDVDKATKRL